jgi:hypothetical protein
MNSNEVINYLEDADNDLFTQVDHDQDKLIEVASLLTMASNLIKMASDLVEEESDNNIADGLLDDLAAVASSFDNSGDEILIKKASVLDELLLTIAADKKILLQNKIAATQKLKDLREKFRNSQKEIDLRKRLRKVNKIDEAERVMKKSDVIKEQKAESPMKHARESRTCADHPGALVVRIADGVYQCSLDEKIYDYNNGFDMYNGEKVSGGSISNQNYFPEFTIPAWTKEKI